MVQFSGSVFQRFKENREARGLGRALWEVVKVIAKKIFEVVDIVFFRGSFSILIRICRREIKRIQIGKDSVESFKQHAKPF